MPYKKSAKKRPAPWKKLRPMRRKPNLGNPKVVYPVAPPNIQRACLKYTETFSPQITTLAPSYQYMWRPNDVYDPNFTGTGHQAMFRDQMFSLYNWVRCVAYRITYKILTDSDSPVEVCLCPVESSTLVSQEALMEYKNSRKGWTTRNKPLTLSYSTLVDRHLGNRKYTALTDDLFKQPQGSALDSKATAWVQFSALNRGDGTTKIYLQVSIKQYVQFSEPTQQGQS